MMFVLARNKIVATLSGHAIEFKKGEPTYVPRDAWDEVIAVGAVPAEELPEDEPKAEVPTDPHERQEALFSAFETIMLRQNRGDFSATGVPSTKAIKSLVSFPVDDRERLTAWEKFKAERGTA